MIGLPPATHQQTIESVSHCGIPAARIRIRYDRVAQDDLMVIAPLSQPLSRGAMHCIIDVTRPMGYYVQFENGRQAAAFGSQLLQEGMERARLEGQQWLRDRGLFENMPRYDAGRETVGAFGRRVESYCGLEPGSAIEPHGRSILSPRAAFLQTLVENPASDVGDKFTCLGNVLAASYLADGGVRFGVLTTPAPGTGRARH